MLSTSKFNLFNVLFVVLFIFSITPILNVIGNVLPAIGGLKINFYIYFIPLFLIFLTFFLINPKKIILLLLSLFFLSYLWVDYSFKSLVENSYGYILILILFTFLRLNQDIVKFKVLVLVFRISLFIPIIISVFQYFGVIPLEFLNAKYVNTGYDFDGNAVYRINGFYYHGLELALSILFSYIIEIYLNKSRLFRIILFFVYGFFIYITMIKMSAAIFLGISLYPIFFNSKIRFFLARNLSFFIYTLLFIFFSLLFLLISNYLVMDLEFLTGRGAIWTIYFLAIKEYSILNYIFGFGFGSSDTLFNIGLSLFPSWFLPDWVPDAHNTFLSLFLSGGILFLYFFFYFFKIYFQYILSINYSFNMFVVYSLVVLIFLFGNTIVLESMSLFWVGLAFLLIISKLNVNHEQV